MPRPIATLAALALAAAACSKDSSGPASEMQGTFVLAAVNGGVPPQAVKRTSDGGRIELQSGGLRFLSRGRVLVYTHTQNFSNLGPGNSYDDTVTATYELRDATLLIRRPGLVPADSWVDTAQLEGNDQLRVKTRDVGLATRVNAVLVYGRQSALLGAR
jgi:hypothetical protein